MKYKVLAADDEIELLDALELFLEKEQIELQKAGDGITALSLFEKNPPHLVLLDIMMPGLDGFSVLRKIRETSKVPVIMVTAKGADYDKILGLELGADDYITKPYNPMEVVARVKAGLRRNYDYREEACKEPQELSLLGLTLNEVEGTVKKRGELIELTKTEYMILKLFMHNPGRVFTKQQIFEHVWEEESYMADDNTVMVHLRCDMCEMLRKVCGEYYDEIEKKGFEFEIEIPEEPCYVMADEKLFSRVIANLLSNAIKYNETGKKIMVFMEEQEGKLQIAVMDDGELLEEEAGNALFRAFVRGDKTRKSDGGTGLGLSIARVIVEKHGGNILYENRQGCNCFRIELGRG